MYYILYTEVTPNMVHGPYEDMDKVMEVCPMLFREDPPKWLKLLKVVD